MVALAILGFVRTGLFKNLFAKMKVLRFEVLPLRVLASNKVVKERLEFKEYLAGYTRQEMDNLDLLPGRYQEIEREMVVVKLDKEGGELEEVSKDMWEEVLWKPERGNSMLRRFERKKRIIIKEKHGGKGEGVGAIKRPVSQMVW